MSFSSNLCFLSDLHNTAILCFQFEQSCGGAMDKASDSNAGGARFETRWGRYVFKHILRGRGELCYDGEIRRREK